MAYTTADLISKIKRRSFLPAAQTQYSDLKLCEVADDQILTTIAPRMRRMDQGYWLEAVDTPLVAAQGAYKFPQHAMWNKVNNAQIVDADGVVINPLTRTEPYNLRWSNDATAGQPSSCYYLHDETVIFPVPSTSVAASMFLRQWIYRRPNRMVPEASAALADAVTDLGATIEIDIGSATLPATFTSGTLVDVFSGVSPFARKATGIPISNVSAPTFEVQQTDLPDYAAGDWFCLQDETVFPPVPIEYVGHLATLCVLELTASQMDMQAYQTQKNEAIGEIDSLLKGAGNRADAQPKTLSLLNSPIAQMLGPRGRRLVRS